MCVAVWCCGVAAAQTPAAPARVTPAAAVRGAESPVADSSEPLIVLRTSGQPERRLRVVNTAVTSSGESVAVVMDVVTSQRFTIPESLLAALRQTRPVTAPTERPLPPVLTTTPASSVETRPVRANAQPVVPATPSQAPTSTASHATGDRWRSATDPFHGTKPPTPDKPER
jgi:hypothetical protein